MVTVASSGLPTITPSWTEDGLIVSVKFSSRSNILSSFIGILNPANLDPAENVTLYGPESLSVPPPVTC